MTAIMTLSQNGDFLDFKIKADQAGPPPPGSAPETGPLDNRCWALAGTSLVHCGPHLCVFGGRYTSPGVADRDQNAGAEGMRAPGRTSSPCLGLVHGMWISIGSKIWA